MDIASKGWDLEIHYQNIPERYPLESPNGATFWCNNGRRQWEKNILQRWGDNLWSPFGLAWRHLTVQHESIHTHSTVQILFILICYWIPVFCAHSQPESTRWIPPRIFQGAGTKHVATGKLWHKHCMLQSMPPAIALNLETSWPARSWKRLKEHLWGAGYMTRLGKSPWCGSHITHTLVIKRGNWNSRFMADFSF